MTKPLFCSPEYMVDSDGFVLSKRGKPLVPSINHKGYRIINVMIDGKRKGLAVHTAVARAFCDGYMPGLEVNHKDGDKGNNSANNLEWVTHNENVRHSINVLGLDQKNDSNPNAKAVIGRDRKSLEIIYRFPALMSAGRFFAGENEKRARHIQNIISCVIRGIHGKKSYKGCVWEYDIQSSQSNDE